MGFTVSISPLWFHFAAGFGLHAECWALRVAKTIQPTLLPHLSYRLSSFIDIFSPIAKS